MQLRQRRSRVRTAVLVTAAAATLGVLAAAVPAQAVAPAPLAAPTVVAAPVAAAVPAPPPGFSLTWSDDFNGAAGTGLPGNNWRYDTGTGFGTGEIEQMTTSTDNVFHDGQGNLVLRALHGSSDPRAGWTSGRIQSQSAEFGAGAGGVVRIESVLRQPDVNQSNGAGYWPAFWMLGKGLREGRTWPGVGEVDIMENVNGRDSVFSALHCGTFPGGPCNEGTGLTGGEQPCPGCKSGFHSYAAEIDRSTSPEEIRYYLDGRVHTTIKADRVDATTWANAVHTSFFILYDLAIGGGFPDAFGGGPNANTVSGGKLIIDSVSVYNKGPATGGSTGGGGGAPAASGTGLVSALNGKCIDVPRSNFSDGVRPGMWNCNGTAAQRWTLANGRVQTQNNLCLDAAGAGTANGTPIQLARCSTNRAQQFVLSGAGDLVNVAANRCVDIVGVNRDNGATLQLWECSGNPNQKWAKR